MLTENEGLSLPSANDIVESYKNFNSTTSVDDDIIDFDFDKN